MTTKLIAYQRVSTVKQGSAGLGMEGQKTAIEQYARQTQGNVICTYTEVESGKRSDRPELAKALAHCRRSKAVLVVAKLDRLARNVAFLSRLMESGVEFVAVDNPSANRLTIHILAAVAEAEAKAISERTKAALAAAKARGTLLGSSRPGHWEGREELRKEAAQRGGQAAGQVHSKKANEAYSDLLPILRQMRNEGHTLQAIADKFNGEGFTTRRGSQFYPAVIQRILDRAGD